MDMRDIRLLDVYKFFKISRCLKMIKIIHQIHKLPEHSSTRSFRFREIIGIGRWNVFIPFQRKIHNLMPCLLKQSTSVKIDGLSSPSIIIINVDK